MVTLLLLSILAASNISLLAEGACPDSLAQTGKKVFCYFEGKKSPEQLDPCPCSHLLYKNVEVDPHSRVSLSSHQVEDLTSLRAANPGLSVLLSLGGQAVDSNTFRSIVSRKDQLNNFTESLNELYQENTIQGIELDWEWPLDTGDKKDKIKLIRYIRQVKLATGDENIKRRIVRRAAETTFSSLELADNTTPLSTEEEANVYVDSDNLITTEWAPTRFSERTTLTPESQTDLELELETTTENRRRRGYVKKRIRTGSRRTTESPQEATTVLRDEERNSLEDVLFNEVDTPSLEDQKFLVALRLSPVPEQLVKGYEFQMLNKFVDIYTLHSQNLTTKYLNATFHHSRLMGVSDIYNSDALIDVVTGLGVPLEKIILNTPAFGNSFNLMSDSVNLPGSASTGLPQTLTYQQVCRVLSVGNWTLERDEDLTGPYSFLGTKWIAFDDDTSLKIKAKYSLLRGLAGVGLDSIDADDLDNVCGKGRQSLLHTLGDVMTNLQRKPRQLIVTSLEQDLLATAQNFIPVTSAGGIHVSPFRIVRIVDREGQIQSIRQNAETVLECSRQGYYRHPQDCSRFYRCVKFNQYENDYTIFEYGCPEGLVFDDRWEVCVWPAQATPCDGSSEIFPIPKEDYKCPGQGFFVDPENCRWFFACLDHLGDGTFTHYEFRCPFGLAFDEANLRCDWPWLVSSCANTGPIPGSQPVLPSRAEAARSFNPGATNSPFPSVPSIPSFESSRTARPDQGSLRSGKVFEENVARDSCENCFSNVLTISGKGRVNDNGLEVASPVGSGSFGRGGQRFRKPKAETFSSTTAPVYDYSVPVSTSAAPPVNPSTPGYGAPAPADPLPVGISVYNPGENGLRPSYSLPVSVTPNTPAYGVTGQQYSTTPAYASPLSSTYAPPAISSTYSPSYNTYKPPSSTLPPPPLESYGLPSADPISSYQPVEDYGVPSASPLPSYEPEPAYQPIEDYGVPSYEPESYEPEPAYQPSEDYGVPSASPLPSYEPEPVYQPIEDYGVPSASPLPSYEPEPAYQPIEDYGVPSASPLPSYEPEPAYQPIEDYGVPSASPLPSYEPEPAYQPVEDYGVPSASPLPSYEPEPAYQPIEDYGVPSASPLPSYEPEPAYQPSEDYGVPSASPLPSYEPEPAYQPSEDYGVPSASPLPSYEPEPAYQPSEDYGVPSASPLPSYEPEPAYQPSEDYGVPAAPLISTERPAYQPSSTYSPPVTPFVTTPKPSYSPAPSYAPSPAPSYAPSQAPSYAPVAVSTTYAPPVEAPAESYGVPLGDPIDDYEYDLTLSQGYEEPLGTYAVPAADTFSGYKSPVVSSTYSPPASLPDNWPSYPPPELPTPPEIQYGGFKPPAEASPPRYQTRPPKVYQQPSYSQSRPDISYGGFKALPSPITPNIPAYGPGSGYSYPKPSNPLVLPQTTRKPVYSSTPGYVSTVGYDDLPSYGGSPSPVPQYSTTLAPPPPPAPQYSTPAPVVNVGSDDGSHESGYNYPTPANPLQLPQRTGRTGPKSKPEVGSVIPVGFSSATLSNGPFSSASSGANPFNERPRQQKSFGNSNNANNIRPNARPVGAFNGGNKASELGQTQNLQSFVSFGPGSGAQAGSGAGGLARPPPRSQVSGSQEGRGGRLVVDDNDNAGVRRPAGNQRPVTASTSIGRVPQTSSNSLTGGTQSQPRPGRPSGSSAGLRPNQVPANSGLRPNVVGSNGRFRPNSASRPTNSGFNGGSRPNAASPNENPRQNGGRQVGNNNGGSFRPNSGRPSNSPPGNAGLRPNGGATRPSGGLRNNAGSPNNLGSNAGFRPNGGSRPNNAQTNGSFRPNGGSRPSAAGPTGGFRPNGGSRPNAAGPTGGFRPNGGSRPNAAGPTGGFRPNGGSRPNAAGPTGGFRPNGGSRPNAAGPTGGFRPNGGSRPNAAGPTGGFRPNGGSRPNAAGPAERPRQTGGRQVGNGNGGSFRPNGGRPTGNSPGGRPSGSFNAGRPFGTSNGGRPNSGSRQNRPRDGSNGGRPSGNGGNSNRRPVNEGFSSGLSRQPLSGNGLEEERRRGKQIGQGVTAISRPTQNRPAVLGKLAGSDNNWNSGTWEKFGPGGFRTFNETLGPEVCQRPGLFRHPTDCTQFYECYWDKWIEKFTLHIFPCPVAMAVRQYDETISACNWPFLGPNCEGGTYH